MRDDFIRAMVTGCAGIGSLVLANAGIGYAGILFMLIGVWLCVWAGFLSVDFAVDRIIYRRANLNETRTRTEAVRKLEIIGRYSTEQMKALGGYLPYVEAIGGSHGPVLQLRVLGEKTVQLAFAFAFLEACNEEELLAIRNAARLARFGNAREQAEDLTQYFIFHGFATEGSGPNPARWVPGGLEQARRWVGYGTIAIEARDGVPETRMEIRRAMRGEEV